MRYYKYICKDGRTRMYYMDKENRLCTKSYPRFIMENHLGRKLNDDEDVHHIDGDKTNNDISNLEIVKHGEHQRQHSTKYINTEVECVVCGKRFIYTNKQMRRYNSDIKSGKYRNITCGKSCAGKLGLLKKSEFGGIGIHNRFKPDAIKGSNPLTPTSL